MKSDSSKTYCAHLMRYKSPELRLLKIREWKKANPELVAIANARSNVKVKAEALAHYGKNGVAMCCWDGCVVVDPDMLTIDHIHNDGSEEAGWGRRTNGVDMYRKWRKQGWPSGLQTLCWNHQWKKEITRRNETSAMGLLKRSESA